MTNSLTNLAEATTSLYVGNLDSRISELELLEMFAGIGPLLRVKLLGGEKPNASLKYGFVEFADRKTAELAMLAFNGKKLYNNEIKVNWAHGNNKEEANSNLNHIFVGDLSNEVTDSVLANSFSHFNSFVEARVMWDSSSGKSRGYGFVGFKDKQDAERAIISMNGILLGGRNIRTNWANHKSCTNQMQSSSSQPTFQAISNMTSLSNTTVYVGNLTPFTTQQQLLPLFQPFGTATEFRLHADRGYAFISFDSHENATMAIMCLNNVVVNGRNIKCSWGKDKSGLASPPNSALPSPTNSVKSNLPIMSLSSSISSLSNTQHSSSLSTPSVSFNSSSMQQHLDLFNFNPFPIKREFDLFQKSSFPSFCKNF